jgi:hypothetical protein
MEGQQPIRGRKDMPNISPRDYIDARSRCGSLLSEAAFGNSPAATACAAGATLSMIAAWDEAAHMRNRRKAA